MAVPAYNEAATVGSVVLAARKHADSVVVVDDGSSDATARIARQAGATVVENEVNGGKGAAVSRIFEFARETDAERLVVLDADWQHHPGEIPALTAPVESGEADIVVGSRYMDEEIGDTPLYRRFGQWVLDGLTTLGTGTDVSDSQSGYRAFSRAAIEAIDPPDTGFGVETYMLRVADEEGLSVTEVPISINYDVPDPSTSNPVWHGLSVVDTVLAVIRDRHPLLFFGVPGAVLALAGLSYGVWTVQIYRTGRQFFVGKALLSAVLSIVGILSVYSAMLMNMIGSKLDRLQ